MTLTSLQLHDERERLERHNKTLLDEIASKELAVAKRKLLIVEEGFAEGVRTYTRMKWLIAILFAAASGYVALLSTDSPTASLAMSTGLAFLGFWFVPDVLDGPLNKSSTSVMMKHVVLHDSSISIPKGPPPDFRNNEWPVLNTLQEQVQNRNASILI